MLGVARLSAFPVHTGLLLDAVVKEGMEFTEATTIPVALIQPFTEIVSE